MVTGGAKRTGFGIGTGVLSLFEEAAEFFVSCGKKDLPRDLDGFE